jgi:hypothetical protein
MIRDAIVEEVRAFRDEIAKEYDYDIGEIFAALRRMEAANPGRHVTLAPRNASDRSPDGTSRAADGPGRTASVASRSR